MRPLEEVRLIDFQVLASGTTRRALAHSGRNKAAKAYPRASGRSRPANSTAVGPKPRSATIWSCVSVRRNRAKLGTTLNDGTWQTSMQKTTVATQRMVEARHADQQHHRKNTVRMIARVATVQWLNHLTGAIEDRDQPSSAPSD